MSNYTNQFIKIQPFSSFTLLFSLESVGSGRNTNSRTKSLDRPAVSCMDVYAYVYAFIFLVAKFELCTRDRTLFSSEPNFWNSRTFAHGIVSFKVACVLPSWPSKRSSSSQGSWLITSIKWWANSASNCVPAPRLISCRASSTGKPLR